MEYFGREILILCKQACAVKSFSVSIYSLQD